MTDDPVDPSLIVKVNAPQWFWAYEYTDFYPSGVRASIDFDKYILPENGLTAIEFCLLETENRPVLSYSSMTQILISIVDVLYSWTFAKLEVKAEEVDLLLSELDTSNSSLDIEPLLSDLDISDLEIGPVLSDLHSSDLEFGPILDDPSTSNWSLNIDMIFSVNTPNLPVEIEQVLNEFNTSDLPARPAEVESTRSSSVENFTDASTTELIERFSDSGSTSSRLSERLSGVSSNDSLDRGYEPESDSEG